MKAPKISPNMLKINNFTKKVRAINPVRSMADHLFGEEHTPKHRLYFGLVIAFVGVSVAKICGHYGELPTVGPAIEIAGDYIGYGIHGLGYTPIFESLMKMMKAAVKD